MINDIFNAFFQVVPYGLFVEIMGAVYIAELLYTFIEKWDML